MVHGETSVAESFAKTVKNELQIDTYVPRLNESVEID